MATNVMSDTDLQSFRLEKFGGADPIQGRFFIDGVPAGALALYAQTGDVEFLYQPDDGAGEVVTQSLLPGTEGQAAVATAERGNRLLEIVGAGNCRLVKVDWGLDEPHPTNNSWKYELMAPGEDGDNVIAIVKTFVDTAGGDYSYKKSPVSRALSKLTDLLMGDTLGPRIIVDVEYSNYWKTLE